MQKAILGFVNLKPGEGKLVLAMFTILALNTAVLELSDVVATAGFISNLGAPKIPWLWIADMLVTLFVASVVVLAIDRMPRLQILSRMLGGLTVFYLLLQLLFRMGAPEWLTYPVLYILADQQFMLFPLAFWILANDVYSMTEAKRLFPVIGAGVAVGSITGNLLAAFAGIYLQRRGGDSAQIFTLSALLLLITLVILRLTFRKRTVRARQSRDSNAGVRETIKVGSDYFLHLPLFRYLGIAMLLSGVTLTIIEYYLLASAEAAFSTSPQFQAFYGLYKTLMVVTLLLLQGFISGRLLTRVPLKNAFAVFPTALLFSCGIAVVIPGIVGAALARFVARVVERSWDEPTRKSVQGLVPDERRGRVSTFLDTYFYTLATIIGAVILLMFLWMSSTGLVSGWTSTVFGLLVAGGTAAGALVASMSARGAYDRSLFDWRLVRSRRKSALDGIEF